MMYLKSLRPLYEKTDLFREWVNYVNESIIVLSEHFSPVKDLADTNYNKRSIGEFRKMGYALMEELEADNYIALEFNSIKALRSLDSIVSNINSHNADFTMERVQGSFDYLGVKWNKNELDTLRNASLYIASAWMTHIGFWVDSILNSIDISCSEETKIKILHNVNSTFIQQKFNDKFTFIKGSDHLEHDEVYNLQWSVFKFKPGNDDTKQDLLFAITNLLNSLKQNKFVEPSCSLRVFRAIFSGHSDLPSNQDKVKWIGTNAELHLFIDLIFPLMKNFEDEIWRVTANCFKTKKDSDFLIDSLRQAKVKEVMSRRKELLIVCANHLLSIYSKVSTTS